MVRDNNGPRPGGLQWSVTCTKFLPRLRNGARGNRSGLTSFRCDSRAGCRAGCRGLEHSCPFSRLRSDAPDASADKQALDSEAASCTTPSRSLFPCVEQQPTQISRRFTGSVLKDSPAGQRPARSFCPACAMAPEATDLDLPAFAVTAEQAAEQAAEVSGTAARSAACAVTRQMPRLISRRLTAGLLPARHLTYEGVTSSNPDYCVARLLCR